jgi:Ser/Thr protein kinase RdoA (MazF antagonist)
LEQGEGYRERLTAILERGFGLGGERIASIARIDSGRVNETHLVSLEGGERYALQKLNQFFGPAETIGENWHRVGLALAGVKVGFPKIVPAKDGGWLYRDGADGSHWRLTGFLSGSPPSKDSAEEAKVSAGVLGLCHSALNVPKPIELLSPLDEGEFTNQKRCQPLDFTVLLSHYRGHPNLDGLKKDIARGEEAARQLPNRPTYVMIFAARDLVIHKDCKSDNFLIDPERPALIDWDTVGYGDPLLDIGEMCRSWAVCQRAPFYDASLAAAIVEGYRRTGLKLSADEYRLLPAVVRGLALNLARRYLTDALAEAYFKWDSEAYPSLHEQNKIRGRHMLDLAEELLDREMELVNI